jgi:uncharacterized protein
LKRSLHHDSIYLLPVFNKFVLYAPLHGITALINQSAAHILQDALAGSQQPALPVLREWLHIFNQPAGNSPADYTEEINPEFLGIIPTRSCNSSCVYCDFKGSTAGSGVISLNLAVKCVDLYIRHILIRGADTFSLHFFGGEPMLAPQIVVAAVHRARLLAMQYNLSAEFEITSNGQYAKEWACFLGDYFTTVVLSFDGPADIQNRHRPCKGGEDSFAAVKQTAEIIGDSQAALALRVCVSNINVGCMEEIAQWFCHSFQPAKINFEVLQPSNDAVAAGLQPPDPYDFAAGFIRARNAAADYGVEVVYGSDLSKPQWSSCPVGKEVLILTPDGLLSCCYLLPERWERKKMNLTIGQIQDTMVIDQDALKAVREIVRVKPRCERCFCRWSCAGGCHVDQTFPGCSPGYTEFCHQTRLITMASLLEQLDRRKETVVLAGSLSEMRRLAEQPSDRLIDWSI